jgi:hypothetical protein
MHTALIFKEQLKIKALREKSLAQTHYSIQHIEGYDLLCYKEKTYIPQSLRQQKRSTPGIMNIYFIRDRLELKRLSGISRNGLVLDKVLNIYCLCSTCQVFKMTKKEQKRKKYRLLPPKRAESDTLSFGHVLCGSGGPIYNKDTSQNTISASLLLFLHSQS